jgi:hypothetical protein
LGRAASVQMPTRVLSVGVLRQQRAGGANIGGQSPLLPPSIGTLRSQSFSHVGDSPLVRSSSSGVSGDGAEGPSLVISTVRHCPHNAQAGLDGSMCLLCVEEPNGSVSARAGHDRSGVNTPTHRGSGLSTPNSIGHRRKLSAPVGLYASSSGNVSPQPLLNSAAAGGSVSGGSGGRSHQHSRHSSSGDGASPSGLRPMHTRSTSHSSPASSPHSLAMGHPSLAVPGGSGGGNGNGVGPLPTQPLNSGTHFLNAEPVGSSLSISPVALIRPPSLSIKERKQQRWSVMAAAGNGAGAPDSAGPVRALPLHVRSDGGPSSASTSSSSSDSSAPVAIGGSPPIAAATAPLPAVAAGPTAPLANSAPAPSSHAHPPTHDS